MSTKAIQNGGESILPGPMTAGLTKREYIAAVALGGLLVADGYVDTLKQQRAARDLAAAALEYADALLLALEGAE
jgi:hypothetical protein